MDVPRYTKYEFNLGYKAIYKCAISYFTILIITGSDISEDLKNDKTSVCSEYNLIGLNGIMLNV